MGKNADMCKEVNMIYLEYDKNRQIDANTNIFDNRGKINKINVIKHEESSLQIKTEVKDLKQANINYLLALQSDLNSYSF